MAGNTLENPQRLRLKLAEYDIYTAEELSSELAAATSSNLVLDCANVRYMDAAALRHLTLLHKRLRRARGVDPTIRIENAAPNIVRLLRLVNFDRVFPIGSR